MAEDSEEECISDSEEILIVSEELKEDSEKVLDEIPGEPEKKKRGRKPKLNKEPKVEDPLGKRKRGRTKKSVITDIKKFKDPNAPSDEKVVFSGSTTHSNLDNFEETQISFGRLNITLQSTPQISENELRKSFDIHFNIAENEKVPNVLSQDNLGSEFIIPRQDSSRDTGNGQGFGQGFEETPEPAMRTFKRQLKKVKKVYKVLPKFQDLEEWPKSSNILCWWCCHSFKNEPVPCPVSHDKIKNTFKAKGIFCSWSCSAAYSMERYKSVSFIYLLKQMISNDFEDIIVAPDRIVLESFGGYMSIEDFRKFGHDPIKKNQEIHISTEYLSYVNQDILETYTQ